MPFDYTNITAITQRKQQLFEVAQHFTSMFYGVEIKENSLTEMDALRVYLYLSLHHNKVAHKSNALLIKLLNASYGDVKNLHAETMSSMTEEDFNSLFQENPEVREYLIVFKDVFNVTENDWREETKEAMSHQYDALKKGLLLYELQQWLKTAENTDKRTFVEQVLIPHLKGAESSVLDFSLLTPLWLCPENEKPDFFSFFNAEISHLSQQNHYSPLTLTWDEPVKQCNYDRWSMLAYCYERYYNRSERLASVSEIESEEEKRERNTKETQYAARMAAFYLVIQWSRSPDQLEKALEKLTFLNRPNFLTYVLDTLCDPKELACYHTQIQKMREASSLFNDVLKPRLLGRQEKDQGMRISIVTSNSGNSQKTSPLSRYPSDGSDEYGNNTDIEISFPTSSFSDSASVENGQKKDSLTLRNPVMPRLLSWNFPLFNRLKKSTSANDAVNVEDKKTSPTSTMKKTPSTSMLIRNL